MEEFVREVVKDTLEMVRQQDILDDKLPENPQARR
jgi:hypothetical protein